MFKYIINKKVQINYYFITKSSTEYGNNRNKHNYNDDTNINDNTNNYEYKSNTIIIQ